MLYLALLSLNVLAASAQNNSAQNTELDINGIATPDLTGLAAEPCPSSGSTTGSPQNTKPNGTPPNGTPPNGNPDPNDPEAESVGFSVQVSIVSFLAIASLL
jgi:hypothetical protein